MRVELKKLLEGSLEGDPGANVLLELIAANFPVRVFRCMCVICVCIFNKGWGWGVFICSVEQTLFILKRLMMTCPGGLCDWPQLKHSLGFQQPVEAVNSGCYVTHCVGEPLLVYCSPGLIGDLYRTG